MFPSNRLVIIWRGGGVCLKSDVQGRRGGRILDEAGQGGRGLENWTIFMEVILCIVPKNTYILKHNNPKNIYIHIYTPRNAAMKGLRLIDAVVVP